VRRDQYWLEIRQTGAGTLGTGVTKAFSQQLGTVPVLKEQCNDIGQLKRATA